MFLPGAAWFVIKNIGSDEEPARPTYGPVWPFFVVMGATLLVIGFSLWMLFD